MTKILSQNTKFISDRLLSALNNAAPSNVEWKQSRDGYDIPVYDGVPLHSTYSVAKEAERQLAAVPADSDVIIAVGVGAAYHLAQLCQNKIIVAVPVDYSLFAAIVSHIDLSSHLQNGTIIIEPTELYQTLYGIYAKKPHAKVSIVGGSYFMSKMRQQTESICLKAAQCSSQAKTEVLTIGKFGIVWHYNIKKNIRRIFDGGYDYSPLIMNDKIILVVGAGYSLTQHIGFIRSNRHRFYIAAADTAAAVLVRNGIVPDSIWTFDAQNISYQHFLCLSSIKQPVRILADFCSPIHIQSENVTTTLVFSAHPYRRVFEAAGWSLRNIDSGCGNIGSAAIRFFRDYFPDVPLVTVGIDFAYYNGYSYSKGSYLDGLRMTRQDYFCTAQNFDTGITYRDKSAAENDGWRTTPLMQGYAAHTMNEILSLSTSPFCRMTHITEEAVLALQPTGEHKLDFASPTLSEAEFHRIEQDYLKQDPTPLLPVEMAKAMYNV
ncbi:MAG: motility associated factor glycosyltransferase family protein [Spirochaetales bacterium]|nr:motility associated factor glycosyltransferase family protein [Spirochaetales bacterium]